MYPVLDQYPKEGDQSLMKIARQHGGEFLCDCVGLVHSTLQTRKVQRSSNEWHSHLSRWEIDRSPGNLACAVHDS